MELKVIEQTKVASEDVATTLRMALEKDLDFVVLVGKKGDEIRILSSGGPTVAEVIGLLEIAKLDLFEKLGD